MFIRLCEGGGAGGGSQGREVWVKKFKFRSAIFTSREVEQSSLHLEALIWDYEIALAYFTVQI